MSDEGLAPKVVRIPLLFLLAAVCLTTGLFLVRGGIGEALKARVILHASAEVGTVESYGDFRVCTDAKTNVFQYCPALVLRESNGTHIEHRLCEGFSDGMDCYQPKLPDEMQKGWRVEMLVDQNELVLSVKVFELADNPVTYTLKHNPYQDPSADPGHRIAASAVALFGAGLAVLGIYMAGLGLKVLLT